MIGSSVEVEGAHGQRERELLLCCGRTHMDPTSAERIKVLVRAGIEWDVLLRMALEHGMEPLLYWNLKATCLEAVPPVAMARFRDAFAFQTLHNLRLIQELVRLLEQFARQDIHIIPFKGPVMALWEYGNLSLRQAGDLDLLIPPASIKAGKELMLSLGYQLETPLSATGLPSRTRKYEYQFVRSDTGIVVELRWRLAWQHLSASLDIGRLWDRCQPVDLSGTIAPRLPAEELLLILCWHGTKHHWARLMWICDIAELVRAHPGLNWGQVRKQAVALGCWRMLALGLLLASDLLGLALPDGLRQAVRADASVRSLAAQVSRHLFRGEESPFYGQSVPGGDGSRDAVSERRRYSVQVIERLPDRALLRLQLAYRWMTPNEKDRALLPLPASFAFLYYLLRPIRLAGEWTRSVSRSLVEKPR